MDIWTHPSLFERKIIHVDMDAFYASVEELERPDLKHLPLVIGGSPQSRAVVCTANYIARKFGIRSAMSCAEAQRRCPQAIFMPPHFEKYTRVSKHIREIFHRFTPWVEPLSLDEAYLDVTAHRLPATQIAEEIRRLIHAETQLTASAGVGPNKLIAKMASDFRKPDGLTVVKPLQVKSFMELQPLRKIHGIGRVTEQQLAARGWKDCRDLWSFSEDDLIAQFGQRFGSWLYFRCHGIDQRSVEVQRERKSIGSESTFDRDTEDLGKIEVAILSHIDELWETLSRKKLRAKTLTIKCKTADFRLLTRSASVKESIASLIECKALVQHLLRLMPKQEYRLAGASFSRFVGEASIEARD